MAKSQKKTPAKKAVAKKANPAVRKPKAAPAKAKVKKPVHAKTKPAAKASKAAKVVKPTKAIGKKDSPAKAPKTTKAPPVAPAAEKPRSKASPTTMEKTSKKNALRTSILARRAPTKPIGFTLDEVRAIAKSNTSKSTEDKPTAKGKSAAAAKTLATAQKPVKPNHVKAASLADILGFDPSKRSAKSAVSEKPVPEKFKRYHKLLLELREHLTGKIDQHSEETLKRSSKDDAGDLSSYGQHMADAGTDTFDRDFALSLVSSEQEALAEIEAAIKRIHDDTYGICEITGKPIAKERLLAVPFTRYSAEAQKEIERNRHRVRTQAGLFSEHGDDSGKLMDIDDSGD